jgi:hypothetical protein
MTYWQALGRGCVLRKLPYTQGICCVVSSAGHHLMASTPCASPRAGQSTTRPHCAHCPSSTSGHSTWYAVTHWHTSVILPDCHDGCIALAGLALRQAPYADTRQVDCVSVSRDTSAPAAVLSLSTRAHGVTSRMLGRSKDRAAVCCAAVLQDWYEGITRKLKW